MSPEQQEIYSFLETFKDVYVSVVEVSRRIGGKGRFSIDRAWARPMLLRMEMEGLIESNEFGEFRTKRTPDATSFKDALQQASPNVPLGETTIICLDRTAGASATQF